MNAQEENWLLVSDVDNTLVGDDAALRRFVDAAGRCAPLIVALNSSRPTASVRRTLSGLPFDVPIRALIGGMGTQIEIDGEPDGPWAERFNGWDRAPIDRVMAKLGHRPHDAEFQTPLKASFAVEPEAQDRAERAVRDTGVPVRIVRSGQSDFDVIPIGADKGEATLHLTDRLGVRFDRLIVAGDSANDLAMFHAAPMGIVVGNARDELRRALTGNGTYLARAERAQGVLEGLRFWGVPIT
jgi:hydroxymethylpyrimidine pyrophosphatase-like HAD family hydrolase